MKKKNNPFYILYQDEPIFHEEPIQQIQPIIPTVASLISNEFNYDSLKAKINNLEINASTKKKYTDDTKMLMRLTNCDNLVNCSTDHKRIIKLIENGKQVRDPTQDYILNTKKVYFKL